MGISNISVGRRSHKVKKEDRKPFTPPFTLGDLFGYPEKTTGNQLLDAVSSISGAGSNDTAHTLRMVEQTQEAGADLEKHAFSVNGRIADAQIRNMHVLAAV